MQNYSLLVFFLQKPQQACAPHQRTYTYKYSGSHHLNRYNHKEYIFFNYGQYFAIVSIGNLLLQSRKFMKCCINLAGKKFK